MNSLKTPKYYRQRFILHLLKLAGGHLTKMDFQKLLFLSQKEKNFSYYDFIPYHYGCYSFQANADIDVLQSFGWIDENQNDINLLASPEDFLRKGEASRIKSFMNQYHDLRGNELVSHVYKNYPYYAIHSRIAANLLNNEDNKKVNSVKNSLIAEEQIVFTLGYEGISIEAYINQLLKHNVQLLCDVRKNPLSRKFGFSKMTLCKLLPKIGIQYVHIPELGIHSELRQDLNSHENRRLLFEDYESKLPNYTNQLRQVLELLNTHKRVALTCFEKEHEDCHRHCVSDYLKDNYKTTVCHI